ncbi:MAG: hypothetical protein IJV50_09155, partial [Lachnospiraceae bacterium]|nr:hypothetical protein [Lachnospiraceae bacterium]
MKKRMSILLAVVLVFSLAACGSTETDEGTGMAEEKQNEIADTSETETNDDSQQVGEAKSESKEMTLESSASNTLIVYFSESGNTETIANYIHDEIGGDMVKIVPVVEYPHVYEELADYAKAEQDHDERPIFEDLGVDPTSYQTVFIGYPIW